MRNTTAAPTHLTRSHRPSVATITNASPGCSASSAVSASALTPWVFRSASPIDLQQAGGVQHGERQACRQAKLSAGLRLVCSRIGDCRARNNCRQPERPPHHKPCSSQAPLPSWKPEPRVSCTHRVTCSPASPTRQLPARTLQAPPAAATRARSAGQSAVWSRVSGTACRLVETAAVSAAQ